MSKSKKTILISPLNWGLGHAVRDIPIIYKLIYSGFNIIIAAEGESAELLKVEFPELTHIELKSFNIKYPAKKAFVFKILFQLPKILSGIKKEHSQLKKIIKKHKIDLIISDNRYGLYSKEIPSVFISHQIFIKLPKKLKFLEKSVYKFQKKITNKFQKILIPDYSGKNNLSGDLSHKFKLPEKYSFIGILSKFEKQTYQNKNFIYDIMVIISGPEPQRSIFEKLITKQLNKINKKILLISGKPKNNFLKTSKNIKTINHLARKEMQTAINSSETIISRAGYTTITDLIKIQKKAILIPTPGQTEQEYLADYHKDKNIFIIKNQNKLNLNKAIKELKNLNPDFSIFNKTKKEDFVTIIKNMFPPVYLNEEKCVTKQNRKK